MEIKTIHTTDDLLPELADLCLRSDDPDLFIGQQIYLEVVAKLRSDAFEVSLAAENMLPGTRVQLYGKRVVLHTNKWLAVCGDRGLRLRFLPDEPADVCCPVVVEEVSPLALPRPRRRVDIPEAVPA